MPKACGTRVKTSICIGTLWQVVGVRVNRRRRDWAALEVDLRGRTSSCRGRSTPESSSSTSFATPGLDRRFTVRATRPSFFLDCEPDEVCEVVEVAVSGPGRASAGHREPGRPRRHGAVEPDDEAPAGALPAPRPSPARGRRGRASRRGETSAPRSRCSTTNEPSRPCGRPTRPTEIQRGSPLLDNVEQQPPVAARTAGANDRPQGPGDAPCRPITFPTSSRPTWSRGRGRRPLELLDPHRSGISTSPGRGGPPGQPPTTPATFSSRETAPEG